MKKLLVIVFLFIVSNAWAVNPMYAKNGARSWSAAAGWSATSSAGVDSIGPPINTTDVIFDATYTGTMTVNNASAVAKTVNFAALSAGTLTLAGTNKLTVSGNFIFNSLSTTTFAPTATTSDALTINASGTLTLNAANLLSNFSATVGTLTLGSNIGFSAVKTNVFSVSTGVTVALGTYTVKGNSVTNRLLLQTAALGTTLTNGMTGATTTTFNNVDFRDIKLSTAGALDLTNGQTNSIGDCGGNSATGGSLTFTTAQNPTTITGNSVSLSASAGQWSGGRVPLPQDTGVINMTAGQTLTIDMPRMWKDISFTTATKLTLGNAVTSYGSLDFTNSGVLAGAFAWTFESQDRSTIKTLTSAGKSFLEAVNVNTFGAGLQLGDAAYFTSTGFTINNGTFKDNGNSITLTTVFSSSNTNTRSIIKIGNWTLGRASTSVLDFTTSTGLTFSDTAGTMTISDTGTSQKTFQGGNNIFGNLSITGGGAGAVLLNQSNTFAKITVGAPKTLTLTSTTNQNVGQFVALGSSGNLITLKASTGGSAATLTKTGGGTIQCEWLDITDTNVSPSGNTWYYGNHSSWHSGTGWIAGEMPNFLPFMSE